MVGQSDRPVESLPRFEWDRVANVKLEVKDHFDADFDDPIHLWYVLLSLNIEWNGAVLEAGRVRKRRGTAGSLTMLAFSLAVRGYTGRRRWSRSRPTAARTSTSCDWPRTRMTTSRSS